MKKKLTLDKTWKFCMRVWRGIAWKKLWGSKESVVTLKSQWAIKHGFPALWGYCFFCEYVRGYVGSCRVCPARKVDPNFDCMNPAYNYRTKPITFYIKLVRLNWIRKTRAWKERYGWVVTVLAIFFLLMGVAFIYSLIWGT